MAEKLGSFRQSMLEQRERFLSKGASELKFVDVESNEDVDEDHKSKRCCCCCCSSEKFKTLIDNARDVAKRAWDMGVSDPRKIVFSAKMGLALTLVSVLIFLQEPSHDISRYSVWAILTVVVVFEFTIGATLSKGFNRGLGTLSAGGLALGMAELSKQFGDLEELAITISIFCMGFVATYMKLYPTMKPYEYGFRVYLLTYCYITVSGYRTGEFIGIAISRFLLIALGAGVCLGVNICIYPIWAGEDLHNLVASNFLNVATSLEGCVNKYLHCVEYERVPSKILTFQASDDPVYSGYRSAVESSSQEDSLMSFAIWEPPHGPYKSFKYPWKSYVKVSGALRHSAFTVMALHGCILSEIQAPGERRDVFKQELKRVGAEGAKVLRELGNKVKKMEKLGSMDVLYEVHEAAEELQNKIDKKSYLLVNAESWEIGNRSKEPSEPEKNLTWEETEDKRVLAYKSMSEAVLKLPDNWEAKNPNPSLNPSLPPTPACNMVKQVSWPNRLSIKADSAPKLEATKTYESASALSLATFASLLIEFVARLQNVVDAFEELSDKAKFKETTEEGDRRSGFWNKVRRCCVL